MHDLSTIRATIYEMLRLSILSESIIESGQNVWGQIDVDRVDAAIY
jgi:hypothetical protein